MTFRFNPERAEEFRDPDRIQSLHLTELAEKLEFTPGQTGLDLGTGSGALLPWFSRQLHPGGVVFGSDISEKYWRFPANMYTADSCQTWS